MLFIIYCVGVIVRCKFLSQLLADKQELTKKRMKADLQDIALRVRRYSLQAMLYSYLPELVRSPYSGETHRELVEEMLRAIQTEINNEVFIKISRVLKIVESSCLETSTPEDDLLQLEEFRKKEGRNIAVRIELEEFCNKADWFLKDGRLLQGLKSILRQPLKPVV